LVRSSRVRRVVPPARPAGCRAAREGPGGRSRSPARAARVGRGRRGGRPTAAPRGACLAVTRCRVNTGAGSSSSTPRRQGGPGRPRTRADRPGRVAVPGRARRRSQGPSRPGNGHVPIRPGLGGGSARARLTFVRFTLRGQNPLSSRRVGHAGWWGPVRFVIPAGPGTARCERTAPAGTRRSMRAGRRRRRRPPSGRRRGFAGVGTPRNPRAQQLAPRRALPRPVALDRPGCPLPTSQLAG